MTTIMRSRSRQIRADQGSDIDRLQPRTWIRRPCRLRRGQGGGPGRSRIRSTRSIRRSIRSPTSSRSLPRTATTFIDKADGYMIPIKFMGRVILRYPKIPKIQQTAIDDFDRNAFDEAIARVDRCQSCHMGDDKKGFENAPQPFRTHSNFDAIILKHPTGQARMHSVPRGPGARGQLRRDGAWRRRALGSSAAAGRRDAVAMHQLPHRCRLAAQAKTASKSRSTGSMASGVPAVGLHRMPSGHWLRRHAQDRAVPEARVAPSSIRRGPCDGSPIRISSAAHPDAELHVHARSGDRRSRRISCR